MRLARVEARVSWRYCTWRKASGAEWSVPTALIVDAWMRVLGVNGTTTRALLPRSTPDLDPALSEFIANSIRPRPNQGEMEGAVYDACRAVWFPDEHKEVT